MSEITLTPGKYDCFVEYSPEYDIANLIDYYIRQYPHLKEIYNRSGAVAVLKEIFDNPALYSFDVGEVERRLQHHERDYNAARDNKLLPEQLEDTIVRLIEQNKDYPVELTREMAAKLVTDEIYDVVGDGCVGLHDLFFIYGIVGFPGLFETDDYRDDIRGMFEDAIDLSSIKKKLEE